MSTTKKENKIETGAGKDTDAASPVKRERLGYRGNRYSPAAVREPKPEQKFQGKCDSLKGFVYDFSDGKQSDRFNLVTKEIAEYVGREYQYGGDIRWAIENLEKFKEEEPKELDTLQLEYRNACGRGASINTSNARTNLRKTAERHTCSSPESAPST
jgi:hypothetical protein